MHYSSLSTLRFQTLEAFSSLISCPSKILYNWNLPHRVNEVIDVKLFSTFRNFSNWYSNLRFLNLCGNGMRGTYLLAGTIALAYEISKFFFNLSSFILSNPSTCSSSVVGTFAIYCTHLHVVIALILSSFFSFEGFGEMKLGVSILEVLELSLVAGFESARLQLTLVASSCCSRLVSPFLGKAPWGLLEIARASCPIWVPNFWWLSNDFEGLFQSLPWTALLCIYWFVSFINLPNISSIKGLFSCCWSPRYNLLPQ